MIKIIMMLIAFISFSSEAKDIEMEENGCYISGKVNLPEYFFKNAKVNLLDQNSKIDSDGFYCIEKKIRDRDILYITVINKNKKTILKNPIYSSEIRKKGEIDVTIERAFAEVTCENRLCSELEVYVYEKNEFILDFKAKIIKSYYDKNDNNTRFKYSKVIRKMKNQAFRVNKKEIKSKQENRENGFFPLKNIRAKDYHNFKYSSYKKKHSISDFLNNKDKFVGLDKKDEHSDIIILNWIRYIHYYGDQIDQISALYSDNLKYKLMEEDTLEKPLILSTLYKSNARKNTFVREKSDYRFYKNSIPNVEQHFKRSGNFIVNQKPDFVNIEFVFENGAWRLDTFNVNEEYARYLENL